MSLFFKLIISLGFSVFYSINLRDNGTTDQLNSVTYNVFKDKTRLTLLLIMNIINYAFLAALLVMALTEIGSQVALDEPARLVLEIQMLFDIAVHVTVLLIANSKRKKIVLELAREFERRRTETYTDDELYEHVREHIVISEKEFSKMLRAIKSKP